LSPDCQAEDAPLRRAPITSSAAGSGLPVIRGRNGAEPMRAMTTASLCSNCCVRKRQEAAHLPLRLRPARARRPGRAGLARVGAASAQGLSRCVTSLASRHAVTSPNHRWFDRASRPDLANQSSKRIRYKERPFGMPLLPPGRAYGKPSPRRRWKTQQMQMYSRAVCWVLVRSNRDA
jgi:hypothetical protein